MNILAFSNCALDPYLGSGKTRRAWAAGLAGRGHTVRVIDSDELLGADREQARGRRARLAWRAWRRLASLDLSGVDVVEFYGAEFWLPIWRCAARPRARRPLLVAHTDGLELLATARSREAGHPPRRRLPGLVEAVNRRLDKLGFLRTDGFVTGCEADRQYALRHKLYEPGQMAVIPPGLDRRYLQRANCDGNKEPGEEVAFLGSWIERKGKSHVVSVMSKLLPARSSLRLNLFGTGVAEETVLADFAPELRPRISIGAKMTTKECIDALTRARVFFFPSEYEGFGLALAEAMACGCAAVTTPTGFGAELTDGVDALVCPFGATEAMGAAITRLLEDSALCSRVAAAGQRRVRVLDWERSAKRLEETYEVWLSGRPVV